MQIIRDIVDLDPARGGTLVPTMGALHEGHRALIRCAADTGIRPVVVSVFVNPTQFGPDEDFDRYPRTLDSDVKDAAEAGADLAFAPSVEAMYPPAAETPVPPLPPVATEPGLEDACRPGHFAGVCQVVARLFDLTAPRRAVFGEKDYQQLQVIQAMVKAAADRWPELEIIAHETIREPDGLALSSRNVYLKGEERERALGLSRALRAAGQLVNAEEAESLMAMVLEAHGLEVDYAVVRDATTLAPVKSLDPPARGLIAARLGAVRLIDNMALAGQT